MKDEIEEITGVHVKDIDEQIDKEDKFKGSQS